MNRGALAVLALTLAACGRPAVPAAAPTSAEVGAELATFRQVLIPLSPESLEQARTSQSEFRESYAHGLAGDNKAPVILFVAYSDPWLLPKEMTARPMSLQQFLRAFGADAETSAAVLIAPKGRIVITREQLLDVLVAARAAGASDATLPFSAIHGIR